MQLSTQQLSTHLCLMALMADFLEPMEISSSNSVDGYSTSPLAPKNLCKHTVGAKYFALARGEKGLVGYEGKIM